ncbi:tripartite motif-containing protein 45-like [Ostrea edulis]|uniref:tripartite motif-containing protein 45-like n=1 Tax=Ostrea edulis TaxID=37623 RepID=UPI0024AF3095|nr:tripartite motif-containing protein 45-like [Ostrea edulis]
MHPRRSAQEVLLCNLCEIVPLQSRCEVCNINLCKACVGEHLSDSSKQHHVMPYLQRKSTPNYPKCPKHANELCKHYCEDCDIPVCITCISSGKHKGHKLSEFLEKLNSKTQSLQKDLEELQTRIYPRYEEMASDVQTEKAEMETNYGKLTTAAEQEGEILHREITAIVNQRKSAIQEMKNKHLSTLIKNTGWSPRYVCCTAGNDILVTMDSYVGEQYKGVRYSGSTEKQSIQFDAQDRPLYSSVGHIIPC